MIHRRATSFSLFVAALLTGCGATPLEPPLVDSDLSLAEDATQSVDTGTPSVDAGTPIEDAGSPSFDAGFPSRDVTLPPRDVTVPPRDAGEPTRDVVIPPRDTGAPSFCALVRCIAGTRCCEALRSCLPNDERCPSDPPPVDAGPARDVGVVDAGPAACRTNADCGSDTSYCAADTCGGTGTCVARPGACTRELDPVCGCDGRTYGNACTAAAAGVRVASRGACAADAGTTTRCSSSRDCGARQECVFSNNACVRDGACMAAIACLRPETFCSCSGETYLACRPDRPTISTGACASADAGSVACRTNDECGRGAYCAGDVCGTAGTCAPRPSACIEIYSPVCGCDGRTYDNSCYAAAGGARVRSRGACTDRM